MQIPGWCGAVDGDDVGLPLDHDDGLFARRPYVHGQFGAALRAGQFRLQSLGARSSATSIYIIMAKCPDSTVMEQSFRLQPIRNNTPVTAAT